MQMRQRLVFSGHDWVDRSGGDIDNSDNGMHEADVVSRNDKDGIESVFKELEVLQTLENQSELFWRLDRLLLVLSVMVDLEVAEADDSGVFVLEFQVGNAAASLTLFIVVLGALHVSQFGIRLFLGQNQTQVGRHVQVDGLPGAQISIILNLGHDFGLHRSLARWKTGSEALIDYLDAVLCISRPRVDRFLQLLLRTHFSNHALTPDLINKAATQRLRTPLYLAEL